MSEMLNMLQNAVAGRSPIVYVFSPEEERILRGIREIAAPNGTPVITWSCVRGLDGEDAATQNPVEAIKTIGTYTAKVNVYKEIKAELNVEVVAE